MIADFLEPFWDFLFDKLGGFGILIATASPVLFLLILAGIIIGIVKLCKAVKARILCSLLNKAQACQESGQLKAAWEYRCQYFGKQKEAPVEEYYRMGMLCLDGRAAGWDCDGTNEDPIHWLKKAAKANHPGARFQLAVFRYENNLDRKPLESALAVAELRLLAEKGLQDAKDFLAKLEQALKLRLSQVSSFRDSKCAAMGHPESQYAMGRQLEGKKDFSGALQWYLLAAEGGHADAQYACGTLYHRGADGIRKDLPKAQRWLQKAAEQNSPGAAFELACMYCAGEGCKVNYETAAKWFEVAANSGNVTAEYNLSVCYFKLAREHAEKHGLEDSVDRLLDCQYMRYLDKGIAWEEKAKEHGYKVP